MLDALGNCGDDEALLLLNVAEDQGFLRQTQVTTEITQDHRFISKPLCDLGGLWAWAKGTLIDFCEDHFGVERVIQNGRRFALAPERSGEEKRRIIEELSHPHQSRKQRRKQKE